MSDSRLSRWALARRWLRILLVGVAIFFVGKVLLGSLFDLTGSPVAAGGWRLDWRMLPIVLAIELLSGGTSVWGWQLTLARLGVQLSFRKAARIWAGSQIVRYIPGNVWHILGRLDFAEQAGLPVDRISASMALEQVFTLLSSLGVVALTAPFWRLRPAQRELLGYWPVMVLLPLGVAALHPRIFTPLLNWALRRLKRPVMGDVLRYRDLLWLTAFYVARRSLSTAALYFVAATLAPLPLGLLPTFAGVAALAWTVGYLSFLTPSGLGVREGVMAVLLTPVMSAPMAAAVAVLARVLAMLSELVFAGLSYFFARTGAAPTHPSSAI